MQTVYLTKKTRTLANMKYKEQRTRDRGKVDGKQKKKDMNSGIELQKWDNGTVDRA